MPPASVAAECYFMKRMLFNATHAEETRVAIVDGQKLVDIDIETAGREAHKSNIYKGIVTRIEPSLEACFVDYGEERHGFLPFKEISRSYFKEGVDYRTATIREAITEGQELIVQVEKEERGTKGAALTTFISLAGRYVVLMPNNPRGGGVSRRVEGEERQELREAMDRLKVPAGMSTIARTAGIGRTTEELQWDLDYLLKLWDAIKEAATPQYELVREENGRRTVQVVKTPTSNGKQLKCLNPAPFLIIEESNLVVRAIRDYFQPDIGEVLVDTDEIYEQARQFMAHVMPDMVDRVKRYREDIPLFTRFQIEHQIETAYSRTVSLPSGGTIVIDHTEALVAVDVNSSRATRGADIEETAFRTNCEAADEVARQMRLRDLGGLIVIDFIDMADTKNQRAVEQRLKDALRYDRARVQMAKISRFGLMELSRQRLRPALAEGNHITCPRCNGVGVIRDTESCALQVLRILQEEAMKEGTGAVNAQVPVDVATFLLNEKRNDITKLEARHRVPIVLIPNTHLETPHYTIERIRQDDERLEDTTPSYNRAEDLEEVADDPYALKSKEDKPARPKQIPVIKNVLPRDPAPVHQEKKPEPESKPAPQMEPVNIHEGFFSRIAKFLFGSKEEKPAAAAAEKPAEKRSRKTREDGEERRRSRGGRRVRRAASENGETRSEETGRRERTSRRRAEKPAAEAAAQGEAAVRETNARPGRRSRRRRPETDEARARRAEAEVKTEQAAAEAPAAEAQAEEVRAEEAQAQAQTPVQAQTQAPAAEAADETQGETRRRRPRRRRRGSRSGEEASAEASAQNAVSAEAQPAAAEPEAPKAGEAPAAAPVSTAEAPAAEAPAELAPAAEPSGLVQIETKHPSTGSDYADEAPRGRRIEHREEPAESEPLVQIETKHAAEGEELKSPEHMADVAQQINESFVGRGERRPRRSRRSRQGETVKTSLKPIAEAVAEMVSAGAAPAEAAKPEAKAEKAAAPAAKRLPDIAVGLEENLRAAGLTQVHTDPKLCEPVTYDAVIYPGRPYVPAPAAEEEGELTQVHTRPELCKPVTYEAVIYPGRPYKAPEAAEEEGPLVQVHTRTEA
jgi:ribonuclease E